MINIKIVIAYMGICVLRKYHVIQARLLDSRIKGSNSQL